MLQKFSRYKNNICKCQLGSIKKKLLFVMRVQSRIESHTRSTSLLTPIVGVRSSQSHPRVWSFSGKIHRTHRKLTLTFVAYCKERMKITIIRGKSCRGRVQERHHLQSFAVLSVSCGPVLSQHPCVTTRVEHCQPGKFASAFGIQRFLLLFDHI